MKAYERTLPGLAVIFVLSDNESFSRGKLDAYQDMFENCPFASIGGLEARLWPFAPHYIAEEDRLDYLAGYIEAAEEMYGPDWKTCSFGWKHTMTISGTEGGDEGEVSGPM